MAQPTRKVCVVCRKEFLAGRSDHKYCSVTCRVRKHRATTFIVEHSTPTTVADFVEAASEHMLNMINKLTDTEKMGALATLWLETPEEFAARKESILYTLLKNKEMKNV